MKGLKLRQNSNWTSNCSSELRPPQKVPWRRGRRGCRGRKGILVVYPGVVYPGAGVEEGTRVEEGAGVDKGYEFSTQLARHNSGAAVGEDYPGTFTAAPR